MVVRSVRTIPKGPKQMVLSYDELGFDGEKLNIFTEHDSHMFQWTKVNTRQTSALKRYMVLQFSKTFNYSCNKMGYGFDS